MPVFKTYLKIVKQNLGAILVYFSVFIVLMISFVKSAGGGTNNFEEASIPFAVIDRDQGEMGEHIQEMLSKTNNYVELADDEQVIKNELFYRRVYYVLVIPEGFTEDFIDGKVEKLQNYQSAGSFKGTFLDTQVSFYNGENLSKGNSGYYMYLYVPYVALAMVISGMSPVLMVFGETDIKKRNRCSSMGNVRMNLELGMGSLVYVILCFVMVNVLGVIMVQSDISLEMYGLCIYVCETDFIQ